MFSRNAIRQFSTAATAGNRVGFYGLGNMGLPMATNLKKAGFEVTAYDITEAGRAAGAEAGLIVHDNVGEVAKNQDFIVTALPRTHDVENLLKQEDGVFANAKEGTTIVDASTIAPDASKRFAADAKKLGMTFADTPMSGGIMGAQAGTLTFMVGCEKEEYDHVTKVLSGMGKTFFHCGGPGTGEVAKLVNNLMLGVNMVATCEGLAIAEKLGMDPKILTEIIGVSSGANRALTQYSPNPRVRDDVPSARGYEGGFGTALIIKDLGLALEAANACDQKVELTEKALEFFVAVDKRGLGKKDFSYVFQYILRNYDV